MLDKKGEALPNQDAALRDIEGIVVFDGTWSQAKTLWWRNAWVLKGKRIVIAPTQAFALRQASQGPRARRALDLEAAALVLGELERKPEIETTLLASFSRMLEKHKASGLTAKVAKPDNRGGGSRLPPPQDRPSRAGPAHSARQKL